MRNGTRATAVAGDADADHDGTCGPVINNTVLARPVRAQLMFARASRPNLLDLEWWSVL
jgi:hypothetical protein